MAKPEQETFFLRSAYYFYLEQHITLSSSNRGGGYFMSADETGFHAKMKKYDQTYNV